MGRMWSCIQKEPWRRKLLFSDRRYAEKCERITPGFPYESFTRTRVRKAQREGKDVFILNAQSLRPMGNNVGPGEYWPPHFKEEELVFDARWRLLYMRSWKWVWPVSMQDGTQDPDDTKVVHMRYAAERKGNKLIHFRNGKPFGSVSRDENVPTWEAVELLLHVAGDATRGMTFVCDDHWDAQRQELSIREVADHRKGEPGETKTWVVVDVRAKHASWLWICVPRIDEYSVNHSNSTIEWTPVRAVEYRRALEKLLKDLKIEKFPDQSGRPVDLPLGKK